MSTTHPGRPRTTAGSAAPTGQCSRPPPPAGGSSSSGRARSCTSPPTATTSAASPRSPSPGRRGHGCGRRQRQRPGSRRRSPPVGRPLRRRTPRERRRRRPPRRSRKGLRDAHDGKGPTAPAGRSAGNSNSPKPSPPRPMMTSWTGEADLLLARGSGEVKTGVYLYPSSHAASPLAATPTGEGGEPSSEATEPNPSPISPPTRRVASEPAARRIVAAERRQTDLFPRRPPRRRPRILRERECGCGARPTRGPLPRLAYRPGEAPAVLGVSDDFFGSTSPRKISAGAARWPEVGRARRARGLARAGRRADPRRGGPGRDDARSLRGRSYVGKPCRCDGARQSCASKGPVVTRRSLLFDARTESAGVEHFLRGRKDDPAFLMGCGNRGERKNPCKSKGAG